MFRTAFGENGVDSECPSPAKKSGEMDLIENPIISRRSRANPRWMQAIQICNCGFTFELGFSLNLAAKCCDRMVDVLTSTPRSPRLGEGLPCLEAIKRVWLPSENLNGRIVW